MSAVKALENATSLERFLNRHVLFLQGIDQNVTKNEVVQVSGGFPTSASCTRKATLCVGHCTCIGTYS